MLSAGTEDLEDAHPRLPISMMQKFHIALPMPLAIVRMLCEMTR
jgi:hypothetical protein